MSPSLESTLISQGDAPDFPLTDNKPVGAPRSGNTFLSRKGNKLIKSIEFWSANDRLVAIKISWYDDESTETYGDTSEGTESKVLSLNSGEIVENASVWKTKDGDAIAYVELQTNGVQYFGVGTKPDSVTPVEEDVGTGYLIAIAGTAGKTLDSLGFLFTSSEVNTDGLYRVVSFQTPPSSSSIKSVVAVEQDFWNNTDGEIGWNFNRSKTYTSSQEWKKSQTEEFGVDASISGGFLGISLGGGASWSESSTEEHGRSWSESETYAWGLTGKLDPGEGVRVTSYVMEGVANSAFTYLIGAEWGGGIAWMPSTTLGWYQGKLFAKGQVTAKRL